MIVNAHHLAIAVASRIAFEQMCQREVLLDEAMIKRTIAEALQAMTQLRIEPEYNHPNIPGATRLDLIGRQSEDGPIALAIETKWVKSGGAIRDWQEELADDALRLECLDDEMAQQNERLLVICGTHQTINAKLINKQRNHDGARFNALPHIASWDPAAATLPRNQERIGIRDCDLGMQKLWKKCAQSFDGVLPVSYQSALLADHRADSRKTCVRAIVWRINRSRNRSEFTVPQDWTRTQSPRGV